MKHLGRKAKRFLTALVAVCLVAGTLPSTLVSAFADTGKDDPYTYELKQDSLVTAIEAAVDGNNLVYEQLDFSGDNAGEYYSLFNPDGTLYELSLSTMGLEGSGAGTSELSLRAFVRIAGDVSDDAGYAVTSSDQVLFLLQNNTTDVVTAKIYMDGKESHRIDVYPAETVNPTENAVEESVDDIVAEEQTIDIEEAYTEPDALEASEIVNGDAVQDADASVQDDVSAPSEEEVTASDEDEQIEAAPEEEIVSDDAVIEENIEENIEEENTITELPAEGSIADGKLLGGTIYDSVCVGENGARAFGMSLDITADSGIMPLDAKATDGDIAALSAEDGQVIDGYGQFTVTDQQSEETYTVTIKDVPTNTSISLNYTGIEITDAAGEPVGATLKDRLFYVPDDASSTDDWEEVSYLKLDGSQKIKTETTEGDDGSTITITYYAVVPYDAAGEEFDLTSGSLWLKNITIVSAKAEIMPIQTNTLCALDGDEYTQTLDGAIEMSSNPQIFYYPGYEDDYLELSRLTNGADYTFYYGTLGSAGDDGYKDLSNLKECEYGQIVKSETTNDAGETIYEYNILPLDENFNVVENTNLYMEYDNVYSFDVEYESMVNEHTEDNGDVYLWMGTEYYVDKYHNQGTTTSNYTNTVPASNMSSAGVWVQLGNIRETLINNGTDFSTYANVTRDQLESEGVTSEIANAVNANYNYGIAGPYTVDDGATAVETYTARVTGHIGDEFVASDVFGTEVVYMVTEKSELHETEWVDLGAHASDDGTRAWWYWINDFYRLNNYEDELEFLEITEREDQATGETQVRLEADEMGASGLGEEYDVWNTDLVTKRDSVVETDLMTNPEKYEADGVGFSAIAGLPHHLQLRMNGTFETVDDQTGETYFGELTVIGDEDAEGNLGPKAPYVEYSVPAIDSSGNDLGIVTGSSYIKMENEQEAASLAFTAEDGTNAYVPQEYMFDDSQVVIYVRINFEGTITSSSGETVTYDYDNPYTYEGTLTAAQLMEAFDTCPNNAGYDFAVNLSEAVHTYINTDTQIILYKVWDDNTNAYDSRGNVDGVVVTLERSEDGRTWETVMDKDDPTKAAEFTIEPPLLDEDSGERS